MEEMQRTRPRFRVKSLSLSFSLCDCVWRGPNAILYRPDSNFSTRDQTVAMKINTTLSVSLAYIPTHTYYSHTHYVCVYIASVLSMVPYMLERMLSPWSTFHFFFFLNNDNKNNNKEYRNMSVPAKRLPAFGSDIEIIAGPIK